MEDKFYTDSMQLGSTRSIDESTGFLHASVITAVPQEYQYNDGVLHKSSEALQESCDSYKDKPINFGDHLPEKLFTVDTPKDQFVGYVKNATYTDGGVKADVVITDKKVIEYIQNNKDVTVSPAFTASTVERNGKRYQENININSLTIINPSLGIEPRGGDSCKFLDTKEKENMDEKEKQLIEKNTLLQQEIKTAVKDFTDSQSKLKEAEKTIESLSKENADLKDKYTDSEKKYFIDSISDSKIDFTDCKNTIACKKKILNENQFLNQNFNSASDEAVNAYYDAFVDSVKKKEDDKKSFNDSLNAQAKNQGQYEQSTLEQAREKYNKARGQ